MCYIFLLTAVLTLYASAPTDPLVFAARLPDDLRDRAVPILQDPRVALRRTRCFARRRRSYDANAHQHTSGEYESAGSKDAWGAARSTVASGSCRLCDLGSPGFLERDRVGG